MELEKGEDQPEQPKEEPPKPIPNVFEQIFQKF